MQRNVFFSRGVILSILLAVFCIPFPAAAQSFGSPEHAAGEYFTEEHAAGIDEVLQQGQQLEASRRWGEALTVYENAVRKYPGNSVIRKRFDVTRTHYDLGRRYNDRSFRNLVDRISLEKALKIYEDVLLNIQTNHIDTPSWKDLVNRGTDCFQLALAEPAFWGWHSQAQDPQRVEAFQAEFRQRMASLNIESPAAARDAVAMAAALGAQRLGLSAPAIVMEYTCGATNTLDLYSTYLTPGQLDEVFSQIEGSFVGLGVELKASGKALVIVRVIRGSPAEKVGILAGDHILAVDGQSTDQLTTVQAANLLQGELGTVAELVVQTSGQASRQVTVRRERIDVASVDDVKIADPDWKIAYLKISCFQKSTSRELDAALWSLHRQGMKSLLIDLRGNPGGLLLTAVDVVDKFLDRGVIVSTRGRSSREDFTYPAHTAGTWGVPLVVLIDQDSASAAEIFAGAIRDHRRGTIVGNRSFGKGSVQGIFRWEIAFEPDPSTRNLGGEPIPRIFPSNSTYAGVRLTTAKFYPPSGQVGVEPDLVVHQVARPVNGTATPNVVSGDEDPVLAAALQVARQRFAQR